MEYISISSSIDDNAIGQEAPLPSINTILKDTSKAFFCKECDRSFNSETSLSIHLKYHRNNLVDMWSSNTVTDLGNSQMAIPNDAVSGIPNSASLGLPSSGSSVADYINTMAQDVRSGNSPMDPRRNPTPVNSTNDQYYGQFSTSNYNPSYGYPQTASSSMMVQLGPSSTQSLNGYSHGTPDPYYSSDIGSIGANINSQHYVPQQNDQYQLNYEESNLTNRMHKFHPYKLTSPVTSPRVNGEEKKSPVENIILDLDSQQRVVGSTDQVDSNVSNGDGLISTQPIWNPHQPQPHPQTSDLCLPADSNDIRPFPHQMNTTIQHVNSSMFTGGTVSNISQDPQRTNYDASMGAALASPSTVSPSPNFMYANTQPPLRKKSDCPPTETAANVKRTKRFHCEICVKWFTSQGHLKRHFNTNLHKNHDKQQKEKSESMEKMKSPNGVSNVPHNPSVVNVPNSQATGGAIYPVQQLANVKMEPTENNHNVPILTPPQDTKFYTPQSVGDNSVNSMPLYQHQVNSTAPQYPIQPYSNYMDLQEARQMPQINYMTRTDSPSSSGSPVYHNSYSNYQSDFIPTPQSSNNSSTSGTSFFHGVPGTLNGGSGYPDTTNSMGSSGSPAYPTNSSPSEFNGNQMSELADIEITDLDIKQESPSESIISNEGSDVTLSSDNSASIKKTKRKRKSASPAVADSETNSSQSEGGKDDFYRECCSKTFTSQCYYTQHQKIHHNLQELKFKCDKCGKKYINEKQFMDHQSKHESGMKPHGCPDCPKRFNHKTDLRRHSCLHSGIKPYTCPECQKSFIRKDHMIKHQNVHLKKQKAENASTKVKSVRRSAVSPYENSIAQQRDMSFMPGSLEMMPGHPMPVMPSYMPHGQPPVLPAGNGVTQANLQMYFDHTRQLGHHGQSPQNGLGGLNEHDGQMSGFNGHIGHYQAY